MILFSIWFLISFLSWCWRVSRLKWFRVWYLKSVFFFVQLLIEQDWLGIGEKVRVWLRLLGCVLGLVLGSGFLSGNWWMDLWSLKCFYSLYLFQRFGVFSRYILGEGMGVAVMFFFDFSWKLFFNCFWNFGQSFSHSGSCFSMRALYLFVWLWLLLIGVRHIGVGANFHVGFH